MITRRSNFIDNKFFVDERDNWHVLPNAPREVRKEFKSFMRLTKEPFIDKKIGLRDGTLPVVREDVGGDFLCA